MCVSQLGHVVEVTADGDWAVVDGAAGPSRVGLVAVDGAVAPGDWLLVNAGLAVARLDAEDVAAIQALEHEATEGDRHAG